MSLSREKWMLIGTILLVVTMTFLFIVPNYQSASFTSQTAIQLELRVQQLQRRQLEVETLRTELIEMERTVRLEYKHVPHSSEMAVIVQSLSVEVDEQTVFDQTFTAGKISRKESEEEGFSVHPLAISMQADFETIIFVLQEAEAMDRLLEISSLRITRSEKDADVMIPTLDAAIGLHAMYDLEAPQQ
jgi:Tfp pilus assembly protein PilO